MPPAIPWHKTLIYELHVKGFTNRHPGIPESVRGTYAALAAPEAIAYLKGLGVTDMDDMDEEGERIVGDSFLVLFNAGEWAVPFALPDLPAGLAWQRELDTSKAEQTPGALRKGTRYPLKERSLALLRLGKKG